MTDSNFVRPDEAVPVQRLLVIQMGAAPPETPPPSGSGTPRSSVPVALQASWPTARGVAPGAAWGCGRAHDA